MGAGKCPDLVTTAIDDFNDVWGHGVLFPVPDGVGDLASLGGDAVVLPKDSPVPVCHLLQLLLRPVSVVPPLLGLLLTDLLQPHPGERARLSVKCRVPLPASLGNISLTSHVWQ